MHKEMQEDTEVFSFGYFNTIYIKVSKVHFM